jgi:mono/diheme cytochrome c family protein
MIFGKVILLALSPALIMPGCKRDDMADQARMKTYSSSPFFANGAAARSLPQGTVTIDGSMNTDDRIPWSQGSNEAASYPFAVGIADLRRGQELFTIYCTPCHGMVGNGDGMIVQRGFSRPPSFHADRLRNAGPGHFYGVITNGWGAMYSFRERIAEEDRWRIAAYIQALQLSQHAALSGLAPSDIAELRGANGQ